MEQLEQFILEHPELNVPLVLLAIGVILVIAVIKAMDAKQDSQLEDRQKEVQPFLNKSLHHSRHNNHAQMHTQKKSNQNIRNESLDNRINKVTSDELTRTKIRKLINMKGQMSDEEFTKVAKQTGLYKYLENL